MLKSCTWIKSAQIIFNISCQFHHASLIYCELMGQIYYPCNPASTHWAMKNPSSRLHNRVLYMCSYWTGSEPSTEIIHYTETQVLLT